MNVLDDQTAAVLKRLVQIAGSKDLVEQAFRELSRNGDVPSLEALVRYIVDNRDAYVQMTALAGADSN